MAKSVKTEPVQTAKLPVVHYMAPELIAAIDRWRTGQEGQPSRSDAVRRLCIRALRADGQEV